MIVMKVYWYWYEVFECYSFYGKGIVIRDRVCSMVYDIFNLNMNWVYVCEGNVDVLVCYCLVLIVCIYDN